MIRMAVITTPSKILICEAMIKRFRTVCNERYTNALIRCYHLCTKHEKQNS